jgi:SAM-dependent methyltransferase
VNEPASTLGCGAEREIPHRVRPGDDVTLSVEPQQRGGPERFGLSHDYLAGKGEMPFEWHEANVDNILRKIEPFHPITPLTRILEVGAGLGWFEIVCAKRGLSCSGIDHNPVSYDAALRLAREHAVDVNIRVADIETIDLGREQYDVVVATSVFEHVERFLVGLSKVYDALRPGGVLYFYSTNKFSLRSGEYPGLPLYGWLPYSARRRIRISAQGPEIVESAGIDFNQFTYWGLRRHFRRLGFSRACDRMDYVDPHDGVSRPTKHVLALRAAKSFPPLRFAYRVFASGNAFICVK